MVKRKNNRERLSVLIWNVYINTPPLEVLRELRNLVARENPDVVFLFEASNLFGRLDVPGYRVDHLKPVRLKRGNRPGTGNVAVLTRRGLSRSDAFVLRMLQFWKGPNKGAPQDPRVYRWLRIRKGGQTWKLGGFHFPFGKEARAESIASVIGWFEKTPFGRPTIAAGDFNMKDAELYNKVTDEVMAQDRGIGRDHAVYRNCRLVSFENLGRNGSNHPALKFVFEV